MTEAEWLTCDKPEKMLLALQDWASERRFRLFTCACLRHIWHQLEIGPQRDAILAAEKYTDDEQDKEAVMSAARAADYEHDNENVTPAMAVTWRTHNHFWINVFHYLAYGDAWKAASLVESTITKHPMLRRDESQLACANLIHCIFGNPFHYPMADSSWLTSTVLSLVRDISNERAFSAMPILADALQDAGCDNDDILNHCRQPGEHVRGCWVVDACLGKS